MRVVRLVVSHGTLAKTMPKLRIFSQDLPVDAKFSAI